MQAWYTAHPEDDPNPPKKEEKAALSQAAPKQGGQAGPKGSGRARTQSSGTQQATAKFKAASSKVLHPRHDSLSFYFAVSTSRQTGVYPLYWCVQLCMYFHLHNP